MYVGQTPDLKILLRPVLAFAAASGRPFSGWCRAQLRPQLWALRSSGRFRRGV